MNEMNSINEKSNIDDMNKMNSMDEKRGMKDISEMNSINEKSNINDMNEMNGTDEKNDMSGIEDMSGMNKTGNTMTYAQYDEVVNRIREEENAKVEKKISFFKNVGIPAFVVAAILTFCLYKSLSGISMMFAVAAVVGYVYYSTKKLEQKWKVGNWLCVGVMGLLAISDFLTGDVEILFYNNLGILLMFFVLVIYTFMGETNWNMLKSIYTCTEMFFATADGGLLFLSDLKLAKVKKQRRIPRNVIYVAIGIVIAVPMLLVTGALLSSADEMFAKLFVKIFYAFDYISLENFNIGTVVGITFTFCVFLTILYGTVRYVSQNDDSKEFSDCKKINPLIAIIVLMPMAFMYGVFSLMQIVFLFGGALPENYDYATYARTGFFQLLAVCIINLIMVLLVQNMFKSHKVEKILLVIVSACTYVMLASSAYRMILYVEKYNLTRLRVKVLWALVLIAVLLAGVMIKIFKDNFKLFRYIVAVVSLLYVCLSFSHMDYFIVKYNKYASEKYGVNLDYNYLNRLSSDAAGAIIEFDNQEMFENYFIIDGTLNRHNSESVRNFNLSRYNAQKCVEEHKKIVSKK